MALYSIFALALALSADAFSFSLGLGMMGVNRRQIFLISITVLIFHVIMPLAGYAVGEIFGAFLGKSASVLGALLLTFLGIRMIWEVFSDKEENFSQFILTSARGIVLLGVTVSLDALSVGFTLGTQRVALGLVAGIIGIVAGVTTFIGLNLGQKIGDWLGDRAVIIGGLILIYMGVTMAF